MRSVPFCSKEETGRRAVDNFFKGVVGTRIRLGPRRSGISSLSATSMREANHDHNSFCSQILGGGPPKPMVGGKKLLAGEGLGKEKKSTRATINESNYRKRWDGKEVLGCSRSPVSKALGYSRKSPDRLLLREKRRANTKLRGGKERASEGGCVRLKKRRTSLKDCRFLQSRNEKGKALRQPFARHDAQLDLESSVASHERKKGKKGKQSLGE